MTQALDLPLDDEDLSRLRPMVDDLMVVARRLRQHQPGGTGQPDHRAGATPASG